jgi:hypothetical protein
MGPAWFKFNISYPLTLLGSILFLCLGSIAMREYYLYLRLSVRLEASIDHWKVIKKSSSSYPIQGSYHFEFRGKTYQGASSLKPPYPLNRPSAQKMIANLEHSRKIWIDPYNPTISSLEKVLPIKKIVYALITLGITLYFWFVETSSKIRSPI